MKRRLVGFLALILSVTMVSVGCGGAEGSSSSFATTETSSYDAGGFEGSLKSANSAGMYDSVEEVAAEAETPSVGEGEYTTTRKIVYTSSINIETKNFEQDIDAVKKLVQQNGGYYENSSVTGTAEYGGRYASYRARIPAKNYQGFMESIGDIGSVTSSDEQVDDITSSYVDVQARLKSLHTKLERLQELEAQAETVEDLLNIEDRINDVQYDIENYTAQLKLYDDQVDYCTVSIYLNEVVTYTEIKADTFWNRLIEAFEGSLSGFISFLQGLVIALVYILPYALIALVVLAIVFTVMKKKGKSPKKPKEVKKETKGEGAKNENYGGPVYSEDKNK